MPTQTMTYNFTRPWFENGWIQEPKKIVHMQARKAWGHNSSKGKQMMLYN